MQTQTTLAKLAKNQSARIIGFSAPSEHVETRFREIGFAEGDIVKILHIGVLFIKSPINVQLHGTSIAMRPSEAAMINVEIDDGKIRSE